MQVTTTPAPNSSLVLQIELPPERLSRAVDDAVRRLSRRTRVPGFRPGKAPRPMLERTLGPGVVELVLAHPIGVTDVAVRTVEAGVVELRSIAVSLTPTASPPPSSAA